MNTPSSALSDEMKGAMSTLLNAVIFEQWLRFSWIEEDEEGDFCIQIPAETVSELVEDYPEYEGLIAQLNGTIVDADMACSAVLGYARSSLGEQSLAVLEHAGESAVLVSAGMGAVLAAAYWMLAERFTKGLLSLSPPVAAIICLAALAALCCECRAMLSEKKLEKELGYES